MRLEIRFGARALIGANDGLEPAICAERYAAALREAIARAHPSAEIVITYTDDRAPTIAKAQSRELERELLDLAWVIRQMHPWG